MDVSIFSRFVSKETSKPKPERDPFHPIPYRKMFSVLDAAGKEAMERYPGDSKTVDDFVWVLKAACKERNQAAQSGYMEPMRAEARFFLSRDRMCAYACVLQPENQGDGITLEEFFEDMHFEGINYGVLEEEIRQELGLGYFHIFPVARGTLPQAGEDGEVEELFKRRRNAGLEVQNGSQVDFSQDVQLEPVRKGTSICVIRPPKAGTDGTDVTGEVLPCPEPAVPSVPQGENTAIRPDGQALIAKVDGLLYIEDNRFCILAQKIIDGDLDQFQGTLKVKGNLYIGGNVDGGVEVVASGDIVINGKLGQARVRSEKGTVRVQQGVYGTQGKTFLKAAGQVQSPVMEWAEINAGTSVIAEAILNSTIHCGGTVYAMTGRGIIVSSLIRAGESVLCRKIGNLAGGRSRFFIGYPPEFLESWDQIKEELAEVQSTVDRLWKPIIDLRKKGSRISDGEKLLLERLVEQRDLYMERREELMAELRLVNKELDKKSKGKIRCEKVHPYLDIQIGKLAEEITTVEENCNIHVVENHILLK